MPTPVTRDQFPAQEHLAYTTANCGHIVPSTSTPTTRSQAAARGAAHINTLPSLRAPAMHMSIAFDKRTLTRLPFQAPGEIQPRKHRTYKRPTYKQTG
ncbi:hypothetical protein HF325_002223 [Metschnikowia pulcherrima]|uniref:Uncharacterized protein n=1 Tax=Metschnikowia pulcherrima TaxID=27326 RepID=A0A8H7GWF7_9ASCO|nr:hypothetical protein HF325_002223 [Metschnikowia pulcherrima]